jgi:hypothetical protein
MHAAPAVGLVKAAPAPTSMADASPVLTAEARMQARFPQPVRIGDLIGLPLLDDGHRTLGYVREVVRTKNDKIELIVGYGGLFGWGVRPVAVPIEVVGIRGRELASLDMPRSEYAGAPTWQASDTTVLPRDATIRVALCRGYYDHDLVRQITFWCFQTCRW